jgi:hypothetical protein
MNRHLIAGVCALALAACGGSDNPTGNAAASASFTYGAPSAATAAQTGALEASVAGSIAFATAPSSDTGLALSDPSTVTAALLGASGFGVDATVAAPAVPAAPVGALSAPGDGARALASATFDNPACATTTATGVTLAGCTLTVDEVSGGDTLHVVVTASGSVSYAVASRTLTWDLHVGESVIITGTTSGTAAASFHLAGSLAVTDTTIVGSMASELLVSASVAGQTMRVGVDESVDVDVTYADPVTCATRVVSGTVDAKRVWTARPQGATPADLPDLAAKVTWTGCGTATVQVGTR